MRLLGSLSSFPVQTNLGERSVLDAVQSYWPYTALPHLFHLTPLDHTSFTLMVDSVTCLVYIANEG